MGSQKLVDLLTAWTQGRFADTDRQTVEQLANTLKLTTICALGQVVPVPLLSVMTHFRDVVDDHIVRRRCPSGACLKAAGARA